MPAGEAYTYVDKQQSNSKHSDGDVVCLNS
jgi:hypothetical protein